MATHFLLAMALLLINQYHGTASGSATLNVTISAPAAGNALIAIPMKSTGQAGAPIVSVAGGGVTFTADVVEGGVSSNNEIWSGLNSSGSGTTITATFASSYGNTEMWVLEVSGEVTSDPRTDGTNHSSATSPGNPNFSIGSITPSAGVDVIILAAVTSLNTVTTPPSGYTQLTGASIGKAYYRIESPPSGSYNPTFVFNTNYYTASGSVVAYRSAGGGATHGIKLNSSLSGLGASGPFFHDRLA